VLRRRVTAYAAAIRLRLFCQYAFRPALAAATAAILDDLAASPAVMAG
jgi:hypothetical protein